MLVDIDFKLQKNSPWYNAGITKKTKTLNESGTGELAITEFHFNPNHHYWAERLKGASVESTRICFICKTLTPGILYSEPPSFVSEHFCEYEFSDILCMIDYRTGLCYDSREFSEMVDNLYKFRNVHQFLSTGKRYPNKFSDLCSTYGVADSLEQVLKKFRKLVQCKDEYVLTYRIVNKSDQPETGGWRWHKNGEYIGNKRSPAHHEYLYDEPDVESVIVFKFIKVKRKE